MREEQRKTAALREDLLEAIDGLRAERNAKGARLSSYNEQVENARNRIRRLDEALGPQQLAMNDLIKTSSQLQRDAEAIRRVQRLEAMLNEIETEPPAKTITPTAGLQREPVRVLSRMIADRLRAWARGSHPDDLPLTGAPAKKARPGEVYAFFINGAKELAPMAARAMIERL